MKDECFECGSEIKDGVCEFCEALSRKSPTAGSVLDSALKETGFEICHYGPSEDKCEKCEKPHKQHFYRRTCYEVEEGEYWCAECVIQEQKDLHDPNGPYSMPSPNVNHEAEEPRRNDET